jgi:hypothetical protein
MKQAPAHAWPEYATTMLKSMSGKISTSKIALAITGAGFPVTKNAVIGRARRLSLSLDNGGGYVRIGKIKWTAQMDATIRLAGERPGVQIAKELNISERALYKRAAAMGVKLFDGRKAKSTSDGKRAIDAVKRTRSNEEAGVIFRNFDAEWSDKRPPERAIAYGPETDLIGPRAVDALRNGVCKWPVGDPDAPDFRFCLAATSGRNYCNHHHAIAYTPYESKAPEKELVRSLRGVLA